MYNNYMFSTIRNPPLPPPPLVLFPNPDLVMTNLIILPSSVNQAAIGEIKVHLIGKGDNCDVC